MKIKNMPTQKVSQEEKIWAAVSYLWILSVIVLIARKNKPYVRFHANQGVLLFVLSLFFWVPLFGWILAIAVAIGAIIGILRALNGEKWSLPIVGGMAEKLGSWVIKTLKV
jgi:uncharacterized membrane protein